MRQRENPVGGVVHQAGFVQAGRRGGLHGFEVAGIGFLGGDAREGQ
jgi:hypothetical protein